MAVSRALRKFAIAIGALALIVVFLLWFAHSGPARRWVLAKAREQLRTRGIEADVASLDYNLFTREVWLRDLRVGEIARIARAHAVIESFSAIREAELEGAEIRVALPLAAGGGGSGGDWRIGKLTVRGGSLRIGDKAFLPIDVLELRGTPRNLEASLRSRKGTASGVPVDELDVAAKLDGPKLALQARARSAESAATLDGSIEDFERLALDYTLRSELARFRPDASGAFTAAGTIRGTAAQPIVTAHVEADSARYGELAGALRGDVTWSGRRVGVRDLRLRTPTGAATGSADIALETGTSRADLQLAELQLEPLSKRFGISPAISSTASGPVRAKWPALDFARASIDADLTLAPTHEHAPTGSVKAHWSPAGVALEFDRLMAAAATAKGNLTIATNGALAGDIALEAANIAETARILGQTLPVAGPVNATASFSGSTRDPAATIHASSHSLAYGKATGIAVELFGRATTEQLDLTAKASNIALASFLPATGIVTAEARIQGSPRSPSGTLIATAPEVTAEGEPLGRLHARASLDGNTVTLESLRLAKGEGALTATGSYDLATERYSVDAVADNFRIDRFSATARSVKLRAADGQARIEGAIETTLSGLAPGKDLEGAVFAKIDAQGPIADAKAGTASVEIPRLEATWSGREIRSESPLLFDYANHRVTIRQADLRSSGASLQATGSIPIDNSATADLRVQAQGPIAAFAKLDTDGTFRFDGTLQGALDNPQPAGTLTIAASKLDQFRNVDIAADIREGIARLDRFSAQWASAKITGTGEVPVPPRKGMSRFRATADRLDLASIPGMPPSIAGETSVELEAEADAFDLRSLRAKLTLPRLQVSTGEQRFEQDGVSTITVENAVATVRQLRLKGTETAFAVTGTAGLEAPYPLALDATGSFDAAILTAASKSVQAAGLTEVSLAIRGNAAKPAVTGFIETRDAQLSVADPALAAENLALRAEFTGDRVEIPHLRGQINGGQMVGRGTAAIQSGSLTGINLTATIASAFLEYPRGLKSRANAALALRGDASKLALTGNINVMEGSFRDPITIERGLLGSLGSPAPSSSQPTLSRLQWDVRIRTASPIAVDNNLARLGVTADLHAIGSPVRTGLTGRVDLEEGGQITLGERDYTIERGAIRFTNEQRIEPVLDVQAKTRVADHEVTMRAQGQPGAKLDVSFSSYPEEPEPEIIALLATGRTLRESQGAEVDIAKQQFLSYLTAGLGGSLTGRAQQALGLSQVRIEPSLIAAETEPTARLTVGQDLSRQFGLVYSMNLRDARDQIWVGRYDITRRFTTQAVRQRDNTYRFQFQHDLRFGGRPDPAREPQAFKRAKKIGKIAIETAEGIDEKLAAKMLGVRAGQSFDFFKLRKGVDRVRDHLRARGHLEASVHVDREETETDIDLAVRVKAGPPVRFVFEGWDAGGSVRDAVREAWSNGVFEAQRIRDATRAIEDGLAATAHLRGSVKTAVTAQPDGKRVLFEIQPGERSKRVETRFPGARAFTPRTLLRLTKTQRQPEAVIAALENHYAGEGFLDARVGPRTVKFERDAAFIEYPIEEGPRYRIGKVEFAGVTIPEGDLHGAVNLWSGDTAAPARFEEAITAVRDVYAARGFTETEVELEPKREADASVNLAFRIREGAQRVLKELRVEGTEHTSESLVRAQLGVEPGKPLGSTDLSHARRNLYATGAFSLAELETQPAGDSQVNLTARVREVRPWELRYGGFFDTENGPGGILDFSNRNMLGNARVIGLRGRYDAELREGRVYFSQPFLRRLPVRTVTSAFLRREVAPAFITDRKGFVVNEEFRWRDRYTLAAGYRFERVHTFEKEPDPVFPFDVRLRVAPLTATFARETRDDLLDATRGSFLSGAWEWGAGPLGSELSFLKYFGQYFRYFPLAKPQLVPWANVWKPRWVYAAGVRVGVAGGLAGQEVVESEHFFAGGGTTVRGFEQNRLGPLMAGQPVGGNAVFVMNHELRFPLYRFLDGVTFVDTGNVYPRIADFRLQDLRSSAGFGVRIRTPYFLLRLDYGAKLDRRPGEGFGRWFFSIGQAF